MEPIDISKLPPEYVNASNAGRIVGLVGVFHFIALSFVLLRTYVRIFMVRSFGIDDGLCIIACGFALFAWVCLVLQVPHGLGRHTEVVSLEDRIELERIGFWKAVFSAGVGLGTLRISMAISLLRLNRELKWYRWSLYALIGFIIAYTIQAITWVFVYCKPYSGWWEFQWANPFDPRCADFNIFLSLGYFNISCNIFTDVVLGALPVPIIWNLKLKLRVRLYVIGILNLGYVALLMGVLKAIFLYTTGGTLDNIFEYWVHVWENLQFNFGLIAACASFLKPIVGRVLKIDSTGGYAYGPGANNCYYHRQRDGRNSQGALQTIGSKYANRRRGELSQLDDEYELHPKDAARDGEHHVVTKVHATGRSKTVISPDHSSVDVVDANHSDGNSEEIILQGRGQVPHGIMMTRDVTVQYTHK